MTRTCRACGETKPLTHFPHNGVRARRRLCKPCFVEWRANYIREWRERNRSRRNSISARYRARRKAQTFPLTYEQQLEIDRIYARADRLTRETGEVHHVDHVYPLKHPLCCGLHVPWNLQVLPGRLNVLKSNSLTVDKLAGKRVISQHVDET